jgi:hypothetical protein
VEHLDVIEHVLSGLITSGMGSATNSVALASPEETLSHRVVATIAAPAHAARDLLAALPQLQLAA